MKKLSWIVLLPVMLAACKKESNITPSRWKIDGVEYSSDNVTKGIGKAIAAIDGYGEDRFGITFYLPYLPTANEYPIVRKNLEQNPSLVILVFYRGTTIYSIAPDENKKLKAEEYDGKAKYTLPLSWYINRSDSTDSVQIEGVFFEP